MSKWEETINKVIKVGNSRAITIPVTMAITMGIEEGDYVVLNYDKETDEIIISKNKRGGN